MFWKLRRFAPDGADGAGDGGGAGAGKDGDKGGAGDGDGKGAAGDGKDKSGAGDGKDGKGGGDDKGGAGDGKPDGDGKGGDATPEKYDLKLSKDSKLAQADVDAVAKFAKDNGLTQKQAEGLLTSRESAATELQAKQTEQIDAQEKDWRAAVAADKKLGATFEDTVRVANVGMDAFIPKDSEIRTFLQQTGLGSHPHVVALFYRLGVEAGEDNHKQGSGGGKAERSKAERVYGTKA